MQTYAKNLEPGDVVVGRASTRTVENVEEAWPIVKITFTDASVERVEPDQVVAYRREAPGFDLLAVPAIAAEHELAAFRADLEGWSESFE